VVSLSRGSQHQVRSANPAHAHAHSHKRAQRRIVWSITGVVLLAAIASAWVGTRALMAKDELQRAIPIATSIQSLISAGDTQGASAQSAELSKRASSAAALTRDPVWRAYEVLPFVGPNLIAFREIAHVVEDVSVDAVVPLTDVAVGLDLSDFKPVAGAINLQPFSESRTKIEAAGAALLTAQAHVREIDTSSTISQISAAADQLSGVVAKAEAGVGVVRRAVTILPAMMGDEGPRKYLVLFQNNAELRATGGLPGAMALIETNNGQIEMSKQATGASFGEFDRPVVDLPTETRGIYTDRVSTYMGDVTLTPHFPTTGLVAREMWKQRYGDEVDGVVSIDPVALSYLLRATGPITLATGDVLTSENAVQQLLTDAYLRLETSDEQDAFFAAAASGVFSAMAQGNVDPKALIAALAQAGDERRILIWSAHDDEQKALAGTTLTGELPVSDSTAERFGVYLNDATGAKMDTLLDVQTGLGEVTCRKDGRPYYAVDVTLTNTAPADAATALPESITGPGIFGVQKGNIKTLIAIYGPKDSQNLGMVQNDAKVPYHPASDAGYPVSQIGVELAPGQSMKTRAYFLGGSGAHGELVAESTPLVRPNPTQPIEVSCTGVVG